MYNNNIILRNFDFSNNVLKIILNASSAKKTPFLLTIFNQYNFLLFKDFFDKFNTLTSFLPSDILLPVLLYIPDSFSLNNNFFFYIKSPNSHFLLKKLLLNYHNNNNLNFSFFINILDLFKIAIIKCLFLSNFWKQNSFCYFKQIKSSFFSLKGSLSSIQYLNLNDSLISKKLFNIFLFI